MSISLEEARNQLFQGLNSGVTCPCCSQFAKMYRRKFNSNMAIFLIDLVKKSNDRIDWIHYTELKFVGRDYNYLPIWNLASTREIQDDDKKHSGFWQPTELGIQFVNGVELIPSHAYLYNNKLRGWSDIKINIQDALGSKFNYQELMNAT